ncbi:signal peptide peptidase [Nitzschia inconspicua]|uniref:Signal peptide peptidase n=1 Tax=Nitzschia inconspicua TaxID=303405 RepID=A0A9K3KMD4_9STRA|nr:signal peptide peptidase [Nitzschia inconspicua]
MPSTDPLIPLSYAAIGLVWTASQFILIPYVVHLLVLVMAILYVACHLSLELREEAPQPGQEGYDPDAPPIETLKKEDAMQFPILGSMSLFGLYLAFKFLGQDLVNLLIGGYFAAVGCGALTLTISPLMDKVCPKSMTTNKIGFKKQISHPLPEWILPKDLELGAIFSTADFLSFITAAAIVALYFQKKYWALNNVLGICFCLQGIERLSLGTYKIGAILLVGLFFYDIFWVFGTDVMVTVAKNLDGPIKLLFPRTLTPNEETGKIELSLLGLGDIVIPGFFLALLLRFDASNAKMPVDKVNIFHNFPKPYFYSAMIAYFLGLATTLFVMIQFKAAQPALLYLVPACLGSSFLCAVVRGEVTELLAYSEEEEEEEEKKDDKETSDKKKD